MIPSPFLSLLVVACVRVRVSSSKKGDVIYNVQKKPDEKINIDGRVIKMCCVWW